MYNGGIKVMAIVIFGKEVVIFFVCLQVVIDFIVLENKVIIKFKRVGLVLVKILGVIFLKGIMIIRMVVKMMVKLQFSNKLNVVCNQSIMFFVVKFMLLVKIGFIKGEINIVLMIIVGLFSINFRVVMFVVNKILIQQFMFLRLMDLYNWVQICILCLLVKFKLFVKLWCRCSNISREK